MGPRWWSAATSDWPNVYRRSAPRYDVEMPFTRKSAIDLGTTSTLIYAPLAGIILNEPSVVAVSVEENAVLAIGTEAKEMIGRTPESIVAHRPLRDGVIADYRVTEAMLRYL